jgi:hypothetical protein
MIPVKKVIFDCAQDFQVCFYLASGQRWRIKRHHQPNPDGAPRCAISAPQVADSFISPDKQSLSLEKISCARASQMLIMNPAFHISAG